MVLLVAWSGAMWWLSPHFAWDAAIDSKPVVPFVLIQLAAGIAYLLTLRALERSSARVLLGLVIVTGLAMRLLQFPATPILEDDFYRYLWDGALALHGVNPFAHVPADLLSGDASLPDEGAPLIEQGREVLARINHPWLRTIYPPTAQAFFALAHLIAPFELLGLRVVWLGLDMVALLLIHGLVRERSDSTFRLAIYWLNPLLVITVFNAGHMELTLVVPMLLVVWLACRRSHIASFGAMALACGAKVWPVLWVPLLMRWSTRRGALLGIGLFTLLAALLAWPIVLAGLGPTSGLSAYAQRWQMNDSAYLLVHELVSRFSSAHGHTLARIITASLVLVVGAIALLRYRPDPSWLAGSMLAVAAALFLLSPTQFPWYYLWVLPLLSITPVWSLLALTASLSLYYLRFPLSAAGQAAWFDYGVVWFQFVPIWVWLALELRGRFAPRPVRVDTASDTPASIVKLIIPALNEAQAIGRVLDAIPAWVTEVIVVDNGSNDATAAVARQHGARVVNEPRRGYGMACLAGLRKLGEADVVVFLDADFSDDPSEMARLVMPIERDQADLVIGSRTLGGALPGSLTVVQRFGNALSCVLIRILYGVHYSDLGPFRAIRRSCLDRLRMDDRDFGWTVQMQVRAARLRLRTLDQPVSYRPRIGTSKISGTLRGVVLAGTKIILTIFRETMHRHEPPAERLIAMARFPEAGRCKTRLMPLLGAEGAANLHRQLVRNTLDVASRLWRRRGTSIEVRSTGSSITLMERLFGRGPTFADQGTGDLGERLARAASDALRSGMSRVAIIGTDCPLLTPDHIERAFELLRDHDVVFGPALDGGYYLVAMRTDQPELFRRIDWGGPDVLQQSIERCRSLGLTVAQLNALPDLDEPADLRVWADAVRTRDAPTLSVVIPTWNEQSNLAGAIASAITAPGIEVIVVDGGSSDQTEAIALAMGARFLRTAPSRGLQQDAGANIARAQTLLFLHADTRLPDDYDAAVRSTLSHEGVIAGAFSLRLDSSRRVARWIERGVAIRCRLLEQPYGDQALFMRQADYVRAGGFRHMGAMEDFEFVRRLRLHGRVLTAAASVLSSARKWERQGWLYTTLRHQWLIASFLLAGGERSARTPENQNLQQRVSDDKENPSRPGR
jgi:rSAM/selenodomain-associated transferase 2/rSAM/selenodomain-associated transferase 1